MSSKRPWRRWTATVAALLLLAQTACGTLLYPERHGRRSGRVDPAVLVLDGALLFFFVIPGVVAFAIDFYTGGVYMTDGHGRAARIDVDPERDSARLEAILGARAGQAIRLDDPRLARYRVPPGTDAALVFERLEASAPDPTWSQLRGRSTETRTSGTLLPRTRHADRG
jgi:hypothetical protein